MKLPAGIVGGVVLGAISCSSPQTHLVHRPAISPSQRCSHTLELTGWRAGDLCDTLETKRKVWVRANTMNGWKPVSAGCWDTSATTDVPYILCWDGEIKKV